jgi:hypothetical protein
MTKARDVANLASTATTVPTTTDVNNIIVEDVMDSK